MRFDAKGFLPAVGLAAVGGAMIVLGWLVRRVDDSHDCSMEGDECVS